MQEKKVLVYGFYGHKNLGDELFKLAFKELFPHINFEFTDCLTAKAIDGVDTIIFGGGSFLNQAIQTEKNGTLKHLYKKKILYIGVGMETMIHEDHYNILENYTLLIAPRTVSDKFNHKALDCEFLPIPDLVYALSHTFPISGKSNPESVLVLPNISVVPSHNAPHWMHSSWDHFKTEFAQFLDYLIEDRKTVNFGIMCHDNKLDDTIALHSIIGSMKHRDTRNILEFIDVETFANHGFVITQRYHGIVLSDMANVPCLPIYHHYKLKSKDSLSYYELSKDKLIEQYNLIKNNHKSKSSINFSAFNQLVEKVNNIIKE